MRTPTRAALQVLIVVLVITAATGASAATNGGATDLPFANLFTQAGNLQPLGAGISYHASTFPLRLSLKPPAGGWGGAQWKTSSHGKPAFAWAAVGRPPLDKPRGDVFIETAFGKTPAVAATVARLRVGGSHLEGTNVGGTAWGKPSPVALGGNAGLQFDGNVWGIYGHVFVPFTSQTHGASPPDSFRLDKGDVFRIIVLDVRGKTVVIFIESFALPPEQFPAFLATAGTILGTLRFSAG